MRAAVASDTVREVIEELAPLERGAGSPGEEVAAHRLRGRFEEAGCVAAVDEEIYLDGYAPLHAALSAVGVAAGLAAVWGRRRVLAALAGAGAAAAIADDCANWRRFARRGLDQRRTTWNMASPRSVRARLDAASAHPVPGS